jgi:hypothetical protein
MDSLNESVKGLADSTTVYRAARTEAYAASLASTEGLLSDQLVGAAAVSRDFFSKEKK